jgi:hypothetical protein
MAFALARPSRESEQRAFKSGFFCPAFLSVALTASPGTPTRPLVVPSKDYSHEGSIAKSVIKGVITLFNNGKTKSRPGGWN